MSTPYIHLPRQIADDPRTKGLPREFAMLLSRLEDGTKNRWVRLQQKQMAEDLGVTRESVNRVAKKLKEWGYLETRDVTTRARGRTSLEYRILFDLPDNMEEKADVISTSHRADHIGADVTPGSLEKGADVILASLPIRDSKFNTDRGESSSTSCVSDASFQLAPQSEPKTKRVSKRTSLGETAEPSLRNRQDAARKGFLNGSCDELWEEFREYHLKHGSLMANWDAAWRSWLLNAVKFKAEREQRNGTRNSPTSFNGNRNNDRRENRSITTRVLEAGYSRPVGQG